MRNQNTFGVILSLFATIRKKSIITLLRAVLALAIFCVPASAFAAWTEPGTTPPGGNVAAPLNVSGVPQTKAGSLSAQAPDGSIFSIKGFSPTYTAKDSQTVAGIWGEGSKALRGLDDTGKEYINGSAGVYGISYQGGGTGQQIGLLGVAGDDSSNSYGIYGWNGGYDNAFAGYFRGYVGVDGNLVLADNPDTVGTTEGALSAVSLCLQGVCKNSWSDIAGQTYFSLDQAPNTIYPSSPTYSSSNFALGGINSTNSAFFFNVGQNRGTFYSSESIVAGPAPDPGVVGDRVCSTNEACSSTDCYGQPATQCGVSGEVCDVNGAGTCVDVLVPTTPGNFAQNGTASYNVTHIKWSSSTDTGGSGLKEYWVYRCDGSAGACTPYSASDKNANKAGTVTAPSIDTVTFDDTGVSGSITYYYQVVAVDNSNNTSSPTSALPVVTPAAPPPSAPIVTLTATPESINQGSQSVLAWTSQYADTLSIDQGIGAVSAPTGTSQVTPQQTTTYTITATGLGGTNTATATVTVTPPDVPPSVPSVAATLWGSNFITLVWGQSTDTDSTGVAGYQLYRCTGATCTINEATDLVTTINGNPASPSYQDNGLASCTVYVYAVKAFDSASPANNSALSAPYGVQTTGRSCPSGGGPIPLGLQTAPNKSVASAQPTVHAASTIIQPLAQVLTKKKLPSFNPFLVSAAQAATGNNNQISPIDPGTVRLTVYQGIIKIVGSSGITAQIGQETTDVKSERTGSAISSTNDLFLVPQNSSTQTEVARFSNTAGVVDLTLSGLVDASQFCLTTQAGGHSCITAWPTSDPGNAGITGITADVPLTVDNSNPAIPKVKLTTPLDVQYGGTGAVSASQARTNLSAAKSGANSDITSLTGLTTPLAINQGGTGTNSVFAFGSLVFAGAGGVYSQDAANLVFDSINHKLGIGTSTPAATLDINGQIKIQGGSPGLNKVLVSDAAGLASWSTISTAGGLTGSGSQNYLSKWGVDGNTLADSQINDNGTSVGIANASPSASYKLDITGKANTSTGYCIAGSCVGSWSDLVLNSRTFSVGTGQPADFNLNGDGTVNNFTAKTKLNLPAATQNFPSYIDQAGTYFNQTYTSRYVFGGDRSGTHSFGIFQSSDALPLLSVSDNGAVGIGTSAATVPTALLQLDSTTKGLLPPRMTQAQRDAIVSPATGLTVYNTTSNQLNLYTGAAWTSVGGGGGTINGSIANTQVAYGTAANTIGGNNNFIFDATNNRLGIGSTSSPSSTLLVNKGTASAGNANDAVATYANSVGSALYAEQQGTGYAGYFSGNLAVTNPSGAFLGSIGTYQNLALQSEAINDNAAWRTTSGSITVTPDVEVGPDGGAQTADEITIGAGAGNARVQNYLSFLSNTNYTLSVWARSTSGTGTLRFAANNGTTTSYSSSFTATTSWQRFSWTFSFGSVSGTPFVGLANTSNLIATTFRAWGFQFEKAPVSGSYVRTAVSAITASQGVLSNGSPIASVTSVGLSAPSIFSVSGSPITTSGTLGLTLTSQNANLVFAAPAVSSGTPLFRSLVKADLPGTVAYTDSANTFSLLQSLTGGISSTEKGNTANDYALYLKRNNDVTPTGFLIRGQNNAGNADLFAVGANGLITTSSVNSASIVDGSIANAELVNSGLTVSAGNGLGGGGAVSLGASTTLSVQLNSSGTSLTTTSGSGLETGASGLSLLKGCTAGQLLKWSAATTSWVCANDVTSGAPTLTDKHIFVGSLAGDPTDVALSGDASIVESGALTVTGIQGTAVANTAPTNSQVLQYNGTNWVPTSLTTGDITDVGNCTTGACFTTSGTGSNLVLHGTTSGTLTLSAPATASGTNTITLPDATGTAILSGHTINGDVSGTLGAGGTTALTLASISGLTTGTYGSATQVPVLTVDAKGRITSASNTAINVPPSGNAGGDLTGTYPNPTIASDAVALGTDTTGNYVLGVSSGNDITVSGSPGEGWSPTVGINATLNNVSTINRTSSNLTLQTSTSGDITINPFGRLLVNSVDTDTNYKTIFGGGLKVNAAIAAQPGAYVTNTNTGGAGLLVDQGAVGIGTLNRLSTLTVKAKNSFAGSGTLASNNATAVIGTGTKFTTEIGIGDRLSLTNGGLPDIRTVVAIADDTHLTLDATTTSNWLTAGYTILPSGLRIDDKTSTAHLVVSDQGNIGVDQLSPSAALHVQGLGTVSGTGTFSTAGATVTGVSSSTHFTNEVTVGDVITAGSPSQSKTVVAVTGNFVLTVDSAFSPNLTNVPFTIQKPVTKFSTNGGAAQVSVTPTGTLALAAISGATDPIGGVNGQTYYNTTSNKFRCFQAGAWTDCIGSSSGGANTALSNLASVAINTSLLPGGTNNTIDLGSAVAQWRSLYLGTSLVAGATTLDLAELSLLDGKDAGLVDTNDAIATAITGVGTLTAGSTGAGFTVNLGTSTITGTLPLANLTNGTSGVPLLGGASNPAYGALNLAGGSSIVSGTLPVTNGGTGASTLASNGVVLVNSAGTGLTSLAGAGASDDGKVLKWNNATTSWILGADNTSSSGGIGQVGDCTVSPCFTGTNGTQLTLKGSGSNNGTIVLNNSAGASGNNTITLPAATGTVALLERAQTFTATQTFNNATAAVFGTAGTAVTIRGAAQAGANLTGSSLTLDAPNGTGTGGSGPLILRTAPVGGSSSNPDVLTERLRITPNGNIVFGSGEGATPSAATLRGAAASGTNIAGADLTFDASNGTGTSSSGALVFRTAPAGVVSGSTADTLAERVRITAAGGVGIGTAAPDANYKLEVTGTGGIKSTSSTATNPAGYFNNSASGTKYALIVDQGNVGIGMLTPSYPLTVLGQFALRNGTGIHTIFQSSSSQAADITYTLPTAQGASGTFLRNDGFGALSWVGGISGSGTTNYIPKFTSASAIGSSALYDNSGNIGIGTTSATSPLTLYTSALPDSGLNHTFVAYNSSTDANGYNAVAGFKKGANVVGSGVYGEFSASSCGSTSCAGVYGSSGGSSASNVYAGYFNGRVGVTGDTTVSGVFAAVKTDYWAATTNGNVYTFTGDANYVIANNFSSAFGAKQVWATMPASITANVGKKMMFCKEASANYGTFTQFVVDAQGAKFVSLSTGMTKGRYLEIIDRDDIVSTYVPTACVEITPIALQSDGTNSVWAVDLLGNSSGVTISDTRPAGID